MKAVPRVATPSYQALAAVGLLGLASLACTSESPVDNTPNPPGQTGGSSNTGGGGSNPTGGVGTGGMGGVDMVQVNGGPKLRALTQREYRNAVAYVLGSAVNAQLKLPADLFNSGFSSIGAGEKSNNEDSVVLYETASRAIAAEIFGDAARWPALVGCQPQTDLSDACVTTFIQTVGKRAYQRDLEQTEVTKWLTVGKETAQLAGSAAPGLAAIVSGILQSPFFLYRKEVHARDAASGRLKYDGPSMAQRLAYLITGAPPKEPLLAAAANGELDTPDGVKMAAASLLNEPTAVDGLSSFFSEFSEIRLVMDVEKSEELFTSFDADTRASMMQATEMFIKNVVLAPTADVRSFFSSPETFVNAKLAPIYGVPAPASGFEKIVLGPETGRAGILGQAGVLAGHSQPDHNSPTRRGVFIATRFLCKKVPPPPDGVVTKLTPDPTKTERQILEVHRQGPCQGCHALFDPLGFALEDFDSIGKFRADERGLPIDASGSLDGVAFDGAAQMGAVMSQNPGAMSCMMTNFYRAANGRLNADADAGLIAGLTEKLAMKGHVWREFVTEFVASDAFRSAPAAPQTAGNQ